MILHRQSVTAPVAPEQQAPDAGNQRLALASVTEPEAESTDPVPTADAAARTRGRIRQEGHGRKGFRHERISTRRPRARRHLDKKGTLKKRTNQITHPTVTSDGNKVTPMTTAGGTTPGNQQVVELVPTTATEFR